MNNTNPKRKNNLTRQRVEKLYRQHPTWTLERYARRLGVSHVTIHYHLVGIKAQAGIRSDKPRKPVRKATRGLSIADPYGQIEGLG